MASEVHYHIFQWHFTHELNPSNFNSYSKGLFLLLSFFAILILLATLFHCTHFCRRRFSLPPTAAGTALAVVTSPLPAHPWIGVDYTVHNMQPSSITNKSLGLVDAAGFETKECCICLSLFQDNEKLKVLKECQHAYHSQCLDRWLSAQPSCPLCRASLQLGDNFLKK